MRPIFTVLLVDHHPICRAGLQNILEGTEFRVVEEVGESGDAVSAMSVLNPQLVVLEIRRPDGEGLNLLRRLKERRPATPVVVITTYENPIYLAGAVAGGASGYFLKAQSRDEVLTGLRRILAGAPFVGPQEVHRTLTRRLGIIESPDLLRPLSQRESEVLHLLGLGLRNKEIARLLFLSDRTVKSHVEHILTKLGLTDRMQAAVWAARHEQECK